MAIVISGVNNNDKITASDGSIDLLSSVNISEIVNLTAPTISASSITVGPSGIQLGATGIATATTFVGNLTGNVNNTGTLLLQIGGSEKFRVGSSGQLGIGGANYGSSGQVLTSGGSGSAATWSTLSGTTINTNADNRIITGSGTPNTLNGEANLTYNGTKLTLTGNSDSPVVEFINTSGASGEGDVLKLRASGRGSGIDDTDIFLITNNTDTRTFGISNAGTVNVTGDIKMSSGKNINSSGIITATSFSGSGANLTGLSTPLSFRNKIINGGMLCFQRGPGSNNLSGSHDGYYDGLADRWAIRAHSSMGTQTYDKNNNRPNDYGASQRIYTTSADSGNASKYYVYDTKLEGQDLQDFEKGTSTAKQFTLSFYVKCNINRVFTCELRDLDNSRMCVKQYTTTNSSWNRYILTFPADTTGRFDNDNNASLWVRFWLSAGANFKSGTSQTTWGSNNDANICPGQTGDLGGRVGDYWYVTGIQLEVGDTATSFEHRTISDELTRCQRYYQIYGAQRHHWMTNVNGSDHRKMVYFPNTMRSSPSVNMYSQSVDGSSVSAQYITPDGYSCKLNGNGRHAAWKHELNAEL